MTNHTRYRRFSEWVTEHVLYNPVRGIIGFNKMPGLDIYYAADSCYEEKARSQRNRLYRLIPRYRFFSRFERAVFGESSQTEILMISDVQKPLFRKYYNTQLERFHLLPPGISRDRAAPANSEEIRAALRHEFEVMDDETLLLMAGSGFITKGLDRILLGMKALPSEVRRKTRLMVIGQDTPAAFERMAELLGLKDRVLILQGRDDVPRFLLGADFLIHPAYVENTGTVLLEAMVAGLPVLATDVCGYAHYITEAGAGELVPSPFKQDTFDDLLHNMIISDNRMRWKKGALDYARTADIYSMPERAADFIAETIN